MPAYCSLGLGRCGKQAAARLPVGERGDDEPFGAAEVLVHVREVDVGDGHDALVVVGTEVEP